MKSASHAIRAAQGIRTGLCLAGAFGALLLTGCGEPAATPTETPEGVKPPAAETPATAETPEPAPITPPAVEQTVDEDQMKTVRKWLDDSVSGDEKLSQPALENLKKMGALAALPLAEIIAQDIDTPKRQIAAMEKLESLKFMTNPRAIEVVIAALDSADADLRLHAIGASGRHKLAGAIPALKRIMNDPKQDFLKNNAAQALIELGDEDALALAISLLQSEDPLTRSRAIYMIRKQGDAKNLPLLKALATDKDRDVRLEVVETCGQVGGVEAVGILAILLDDGDASVLRDTCKHLKRITGVTIARDPAKWKEWVEKEFKVKGEKAFAKKGGAKPQPGEDAEGPQPRVKVKPKPQRNAGEPPPDEDGLVPEDNEPAQQ